MARKQQLAAMLPVAAGSIMQSILLLRGQRVMLDASLAALYQVETRALTQAVKRNPGRFPPDFMFKPAREGFADLRSQPVISSEVSATARAMPPCSTRPLPLT